MAVDSVPGNLSRENGAARAGVVVMLLGMLMFSVNDVMGKWLVATYSVGQVVLIRSIAAALLLAPFLWVS
ncbi:EamA/RhaT family transporter, partial [Sinorhizobium meliloti]